MEYTNKLVYKLNKFIIRVTGKEISQCYRILQKCELFCHRDIIIFPNVSSPASNFHEKVICQDKRETIRCSGRKIKVRSAYYGKTTMFLCGMGLTTNCKAPGSEAKVM